MVPSQDQLRGAHRGSKKFRSAEREAQARYNIPLADAGRDYISRVDNWREYRNNYDNIFRKKKGGSQ